jgi:hypothetical protein
MSATEHEFCEHGICLKCERCDMCTDIKEGKKAALKIIDEILAQRSRKD